VALKVTVVLAGEFREAAGCREIVEELPEGSMVKDLVLKLASKYGGVFNSISPLLIRAEIRNPGHEHVSRDVILLVNSTTVYSLNHKLRDGDRVTISDLLEASLAGG
jgi:molybdopterin converting factor small subunit